ncbi:DUF6166 domain-containing protein [Gemmata sp. JC717]|uniref:DUF6166 domain-containing protein n=1 Tax=Gemmata algarum TaxID=2975278 RepID=UPI0021BA4855|nr:DUF6166 domain-containing protein [Gemmata algarum]MDY3557341.1 DUF6166 domain-containing protein [Gemmata algarum]
MPGDLSGAALDLRNHSPSGFEVAYLGSGPAQLAIAIATDVLGDEHGQDVYQAFKRDVIAQLPREGFAITAEAVQTWADELEKKEQS